MKKLILYVFLFTSIFANELNLDHLLSDFESENDLSFKTKKEKTGSMQLIVYTREDLDRLQYQSLKDIINVQRFLPYRESRIGVSDLVKSEPMRVGKGGQLVKVYIDEFELSTLQYDTVTHVLGNIELDFVNHVEVYQGPPSLEISTKASLMVIKLYSKNPQRDDGNKIGMITDNYGSKSSFFYLANGEEPLEYFLHFSNNDSKREVIKNGNTNLSRDEKRKHLFSTFNYDEHKIHLQYIEKTKDGFLTNSHDGTPTKDDMKQTFWNIGYSKSFLEDDLTTFKLNYTKTTDTVNFEDDKPLPISQILHTSVYREQYESDDEILSLTLNKKIYLQKHEIFTGLNYTNKRLIDNQNNLIGTSKTISVKNKLNEQKTYSVYLQDTYKYNDYNAFLVGAKFEKENNSFYNNEKLLTSRFSHTYEKNNLIFMTYYTEMKINKISYLFNSSNKDLENEYIKILGHETKYKNNNFEISYNIMDFKLYNIFSLNSDIEFYNSEPYKIIFNSIQVDYHFNKQHSFVFQPWRQDVNIEEEKLKFYTEGLYIRFLDTVQKFTFLNEFLFLKTDQFDIIDKEEWQYNLGITYKYTKDFTIFIKGENIFDKRSGYQYHNYYDNKKAIDSIEERYSLGMEYTF